MPTIYYNLKLSSNSSTYQFDKQVHLIDAFTSSESPNLTVGAVYEVGEIVNDYLLSKKSIYEITKVNNTAYSGNQVTWDLVTDSFAFTPYVATSLLNSIKSDVLDKYNFPSFVVSSLVSGSSATLTVGTDPNVSGTQSSATQSKPAQVTPISPTQSTVPLSQTQSATPAKAPTDTGVDQPNSRNTQDQANSQQQPNAGKQNTNSIVPTSLTKKFGPSKTILGIRPITFDTAQMPQQSKQELANGLGYVPFVWYNTYQIEPNNIKFFTLYNDGILPKIKLLFMDPMNLMQDTGFPLDDTKIQIFINSRNKNIKSILMQFKITNFSLDDNSNYAIEGVADVSKLYVRQFIAYKNKTSNDALQDLCKYCGIGFNNNIDNTDDSMTWINPGNINIDFLEEVLSTSYKSDESYMTGYVDYYYSFNYVDIEKELNRNVDDQLGVYVNGLEDILNLPNKDQVNKLYLTNDGSMANSPNYFNDFKVLNNSTEISLRKGYLNKVKFYDTLQKVIKLLF